MKCAARNADKHNNNNNNNRESYEFLRQLTAQFIARLKVFLPPETWACWALTREGRYQLRKKVAGYIVARDKVCDYSNPQLKHNEAAWTMKQQVAHAFLLVDESQEDHDWDDDMRRDRSRDDVTGEEEEQDGEQDAQDEVIYDLLVCHMNYAILFITINLFYMLVYYIIYIAVLISTLFSSRTITL